MSSATLHRFAKAVAIYSLLVVPPVFGLLAILHLGEDLRAPRSIGGDWKVSGSIATCRSFVFGDTPATLTISQSGLRAVGKLSDASHTALSLEIEGTTITGEQDQATGCHVALAAQLSASSELVGVLRWPGCTGCSEQPFHALRGAR
jgi:hypothetical protein